MLLHISHDDKFFDYFIAKSSKIRNDNQYLVYSNEAELKYVKSKNVIVSKYGSKYFDEILADPFKYDIIYIHYLSTEMVHFVNLLPSKTKIVWVFWGNDLFRISDFRELNYLPLTDELIHKVQLTNVKGLKAIKRGIGRILLNYKWWKDKKYFLKAIKKISYFAHYIHEDFSLLTKFNDINTYYIPFCYCSVFDVYKIDVDINKKRLNIILGNSASQTNNHLDAIEILSKLDINVQVIVPLSYPKSPVYIDAILSKGHISLGKYYKPLLDFMPLNDYLDLIDGVGFAIMPQLRSQAWGNIMALLWQGVKVFMHSESNLYKLLIRYGFTVFDLTCISKESLQNPLDTKQIQENRFLLDKYFGDNETNLRYEKLLSLGEK